MSGSPAAFPNERSRAFPAIAWAGLVAGILDISSAFVIWNLKGIGPVRGLQGIATGLLGRASFQGGLSSAALGLAAHFFIAFVAAAVFYIASRKLHFLTQHAIASGLAYGIAVYLFMNFVVLPLASIKALYSLSNVSLGVVILMVLLGLPIALIVRRYSSPTPAR